MRLPDDDRLALVELDSRLRTLLPDEYHTTYEAMEPAPMGSAPMKLGPDGRVAWNEIWKTFCDLAMAGGPPHKGRLLGPATAAEIEAAPDQYAHVVAEICRGVEMVTTMPCEPADPGWVRVECYSPTMAAWLLRAIVMENVAARADGVMLDLPASPMFRLEKEIKNVVTVIAKTCHYWDGHMPLSQHRAITALLAALAAAGPPVAPVWSAGTGGGSALPNTGLFAHIERLTGLGAAPLQYDGWIGLECPSVRMAVWMMRGLVALDVLSRRETQALYVPLNPAVDPTGARAAGAVARLHRLAAARAIMVQG